MITAFVLCCFVDGYERILPTIWVREQTGSALSLLLVLLSRTQARAHTYITYETILTRIKTPAQ